MTLNQELSADLASGELADLFETVTLDGAAKSAMVSDDPIGEELEIGGQRLSSEKEFKFRRSVAVPTRSSVIVYGGNTFDVTSILDRPGHPLVAVRAMMRA
jgi:hypothetical protein